MRYLRTLSILVLLWSCTSPQDETTSPAPGAGGTTDPDGLRAQTKAYASECLMPMDPYGTPSCNVCARDAYAWYRTYACQNHCCAPGTEGTTCEPNYENPYEIFVECRKRWQAYNLEQAACYVVGGDRENESSCCTQQAQISEMAWEAAQEVAEEVAGKALGQLLNPLRCPPHQVLCEDTGCGKTRTWCVPLQATCKSEDPFLCELTVDQFGACDDDTPCPAGKTKMYHRPENGVTGGAWHCEAEGDAGDCNQDARPRQCSRGGGFCYDCDDTDCPPGFRWDRVANNCRQCPPGYSVFINNDTGAATCVATPKCASGVQPYDVTPIWPDCPLSCDAPLRCTWSKVSLCGGDPCWVCPYCDRG